VPLLMIMSAPQGRDFCLPCFCWHPRAQGTQKGLKKRLVDEKFCLPLCCNIPSPLPGSSHSSPEGPSWPRDETLLCSPGFRGCSVLYP
jgi:hypothetical protein